jgi:hypothetical protein
MLVNHLRWLLLALAVGMAGCGTALVVSRVSERVGSLEGY